MTLIPDAYYHDPGAVLKDVKMSDPDLIISSSCTEIYDSAFLYSKNTLQSFTFQENPQLTKIGSNAFYSCASLTKIDLSKCSLLQTISTRAFYQCKSVKSLLLPDGLQEILSVAFLGIQISTLTIPSSVKTIGESAFGDISTLLSITFNEGSQLLELTKNAFYKTSLLEFTVPESVNSINGMFINAVITMKKIKVHQNNQYFESDGNAVYTKNFSKIVAFAANSTTSYVINSKVQIIGNATFMRARLSSITIPPSVTVIQSYAFYETINLKEINLPPNITEIPEAWFFNSGLTSITIPDNVTSIESLAFASCNSLTTIVLPEGLEYIGGGAFPSNKNIKIVFPEASSVQLDDQMLIISKDKTYISMCLNSSAISITIPSSVKTIKQRAFMSAKQLTTVICDGTSEVEVIENYAFYLCEQLTSIPSFPKLKQIGEYAFSKTKINSAISFSPYLEKIGQYCFYLAQSISRITFSSTTTALYFNDFCFSGCTSLSSIDLHDCTCNIYFRKNVFSDCSSLSMFNVNDKIKSFDSCCFMNSGLETINFANSYTSFDTLPSMFLKGCTNIEEIIIPTNIEIIGNECFSETSISYISIPDSVTTLSTQCFSGCSQLDHVDISSTSGLTTIMGSIFEGCTSLSYISDFRSSKFVCVNSTIYDVGFSQVYIHAPGCKDRYISFDSRLVTVSEGAFINSRYIELVVFVENSVRIIGRRSFESCIRLEHISIPSSVVSIGSDAFIHCDSLRCGVLFQNKTQPFIELLVSSGLPKSSLRLCSVFSCAVRNCNTFSISFSLFTVFILM
ncbi:surface antigen BspA-like [Trichomonas vaginalis G3]|uniref:Surface antigen BspA-like n=1 Tax=Trichomonas vaginalis (strain ATCC PRA-98 / G3) TaxID=412133 RepID=A2FJJ9_TRIV3|nr:regulation of response to stimulus [Trichomonas vaginalis G3]EAX94931.1 surface antigen BspA-like [Trichomonas vaginalis G3]KAI5529776.1 regulation of response to stimulus [Trichomonas vaginalis G3]|eukprot:XP_001307861.1 surface antigen BspA-like [Trichomonas vaginalis G3]